MAICVAELEDVYKWGRVTISKELLNQLLPGPVTLCFERLPSLNQRLNPDSNLIGIRIPDHSFIRGVCREIQLPLALTSANISNAKSALSIEEFSELYGQLSCIVDGGTLGLDEKSRLGSTVIDLSHQGSYKVIRPGDVCCGVFKKLVKDILRERITSSPIAFSFYDNYQERGLTQSGASRPAAEPKDLHL